MAMAAGVHGACHQLLAGARLAVHQHRRHAARHLGDAPLDRAHDRRLAHQARQRLPARRLVVRRERRRSIGRRQRRRRRHRLGRLQGRLHDGAKLPQIDRLGQVVEGPALSASTAFSGEP
jgi:hypothetical protein